VTLLALPGFAIVFLVVSVLWRPPVWFAAGYLSASVITFVTYAIDKSAAKAQASRAPESTLHALALAGGWPGALLAQQWLRHKSTKQSFRQTFWLTVAVNTIGFVLLCSPPGRGLWSTA
jgi:uncharacterized membrane protein YsdA (DUF1294 family)